MVGLALNFKMCVWLGGGGGFLAPERRWRSLALGFNRRREAAQRPLVPLRHFNPPLLGPTILVFVMLRDSLNHSLSTQWTRLTDEINQLLERMGSSCFESDEVL